MRFCFDEMRSWWFGCTLLAFSAVFSEQRNIKENEMLYNRNGNVSIIGLFNSFSGDECTVEVAKGLEETAAAIWTVEALNNIHYLPGVSIGISIIDGCHFLNRQKRFFRITEDARINESGVNVGILTSGEIYKKLPNFENSTLKITQLNHIVSPQLLVESTLQLLLNLQWVTLRAFTSDSPDILNLFRERVSEEIIKVLDYFLINERDLNLQQGAAASDDETASVTVVIAAFNNITYIGKKMLNSKLIITPTDFTFDFTGFPNGTIVLLPSMESKSVLSKYIKSTARYKNFFSHKGPTKSPLFIGTAVNILKLLKPVKNLLGERCGNVNLNPGHPCANVVNFVGELNDNKTGLKAPEKISPDDILETLSVLNIKPSFNDEMFLYIASVLNPNVSEDLSIFKIFSIQTKKFGPVLLKINDNLVRNREIFDKPGGIKYIGQIFEPDADETKEFPNSLIRLSQKFPSEGNFPKEIVGNVTTADCDNDGECRRFDRYPKSPNQTVTAVLGWRFLTWVCINTALAFTGVTCTLSVMFFVFIRVFKGDVTESSLCFNLLLMVSVVFMYSSSLLYHVEYLVDDRLLCFFRINVPPVVCAILFSLLLSRSLMLAFDEFDNHVNGYLHVILCVFMISLQVSITVQSRNFENADGNCSEAHEQYRLIIAFSYNFILLIFLACVSPFIICSKRNNKEGLLISVSVFFITIVWSTWICFYILFSSNYKDAAVAIGLNSTATVIVLCIFIPRTYFMAVPVIQDSTVCYIPTLGKLTDNLNVRGRSSQALNDSAVGVINYRDCELGTSNPNFYASRTDEGDRVGVRESVVDLSSETGQ